MSDGKEVTGQLLLFSSNVFNFPNHLLKLAIYFTADKGDGERKDSVGSWVLNLIFHF